MARAVQYTQGVDAATLGPESVAAAVGRAARAQRAWSAIPAPGRGRVIGRWARRIEQGAASLAALMTDEMGKLLAEATGEVGMAVRVADYYAGAGLRLQGATLPSMHPGALITTLREPLGVVGLITPWNFPAVIPVWKIAPALVAGNAAVLKPSEVTPKTAQLLADWLAEAGGPAGVLEVVHGAGDVGAALAAHPTIRAVSFTGSTATGRKVQAAAATHGARVNCEMGGKNPLVVMDDADLDQALSAVVSGAFGTTGQRCTATSRLYLQAGIAQEFTARLLAAARTKQIAPLASDAQATRVQAHLTAALSSGLTPACGGAIEGRAVPPTVFLSPPHDHSIATEEVFGPVLCVWPVTDLDEAITRANATSYGLSAAIYTRDSVAAMRFAHDVRAGMVHVNGPTIGSEAQIPFGGIGDSGVGPKELGDAAIEFFTDLKTVSIRY